MLCASYPWSINGGRAIEAIRHILKFQADDFMPWCPHEYGEGHAPSPPNLWVLAPVRDTVTLAAGTALDGG